MSGRTMLSMTRGRAAFQATTLVRNRDIVVGYTTKNPKQSHSFTSFGATILRHNGDEDDENTQKYGHERRCTTTARLPSVFTVSHASMSGIRPQSIDRRLMPSSSLFVRHAYHTSAKHESTALVMGLGAMALTAKAGQYAVHAYKEYKENIPEEEQPEEPSVQASSSAKESTTEQEKKKTTKKNNKTENMFQSWFGAGSKYYEGGFEEKMTRREAALILGCRESSTAKRIKGAHRKILILNHPDTGGSTYIASKLNEAKELLLKGKET